MNNKLTSKIRKIVNFHELSPEWQREAIRNLDEYAEEVSYLEPEDGNNPQEHILRDLSEATQQEGEHAGFKYNAVIGISNNSAMLLNISDCGKCAKVMYI